MNLVDLDISAARESAAIRAELEKQGTPIVSYDLLVAGIARSRDMVLVTNKTREFDGIVRLNMENWVL